MESINDNFINRFKLFYKLQNNQNLNRGIEFLKKGNKIYIKKKNRGSFTKYCGGNVTDKCIQQGKNSPDPAIRKKATFADNSRKWNH